MIYFSMLIVCCEKFDVWFSGIFYGTAFIPGLIIVKGIFNYYREQSPYGKYHLHTTKHVSLIPQGFCL
jgi:hypothetical protein